jgi:hypothetical protein
MPWRCFQDFMVVRLYDDGDVDWEIILPIKSRLLVRFFEIPYI